MDRDQAQGRIDRIHAFRAEVATLADEGVTLPPPLAAAIGHHHDALLARLAAEFDVDTSSGQKQLSLGMRVAAFLGALAFSAAVYFFFLRFWGELGTAMQVAILASAPIAATLGVEFAARRERTLYIASITALVAFAAFVLDLAMLGRIFSITPTQNAFLVWGLFALLLAYGYGLRLLLVAGLTCLLGYLAATVGTWGGGYWLSFGERPENFLLAGAAITAFGVAPQRRHPAFAGIYRVFGLLTLFIAILVLANWGRTSYLPLARETIENLYQLLGFGLAGLTIWAGIRRQWNGVTHVGTTFFVLYLYTKLFDWWWEWMPKYLFFLLLGAIALGLLRLMGRLRRLGGGLPQ